MLQIFNAHPALYWGEDSDFARPFAALGAFAVPADHVHSTSWIPTGYGGTDPEEKP